jgi:CheY-like chemotaxis protein
MMHGGRIDAHSDGPGKGCRFTVQLPTAGEAAGENEESGSDPTSPAASPPRRILVVDDNQDAAESLGLYLGMFGHDVRLAFDGLAALAMAGEFRPHIALIDIGLPKLNGYDTARRIREEAWGQAMVLVAVTGWGQDEDVRRAREAGFDEHMTKPVDPQALVQLVAQLPPEAAP